MDLQTSGLDRIVAALDPTPEVYYNASDILGILYHNPPLHSRLSAYPPFIAMADRQEFQDIATDADFQNLLASQSSIGQLLENPKTQAILSNTELLGQLREIDLKDLQHYLKTGVSEKYQDVPILGRWEIDPYLTFILEKRRKTGMTAADVRMLRYHIEFVKGFKLYIAPDNTVKLKGPDISQMAGRLPEIERALAAGSKPRPQVQVIQVPQTADPQSDPSASPTYNRMLSERYGLRGGRGGGPGEPAPAPATLVPQQAAAAAVPALMTTTELAAEIAKLPMTLLAEGTWKEQDSRYVVSLRPQKEVSQFLGTRRSSNIEASMREDWLQLSEGSQAMALLKF
jgi:hypothetical protein